MIDMSYNTKIPDSLRRIILTKFMDPVENLQHYYLSLFNHNQKVKISQKYINKRLNISKPSNYFMFLPSQLLFIIIRMDLFSFMKKVNKTTIASSRPKSSAQKKLQTQVSVPIMPQLQKSTTTNTSNVKTIISVQKYKINVKEAIQILQNIKIVLQDQLNELLNDNNLQKNQIHNHLLNTPFFRFEEVDESKLLERYEKIIQSCQMLNSKLKNNESLKQFVFVKNADQFLLFFKSLFSKPYNLFKISYTRKVIQVLWEKQIFNSNNISRCLENLKLWLYGIALPANPAAIALHKLIFTNPSMISKYVKFNQPQSIYVQINRSDSLGYTPFLLAIISDNLEAAEKLIKSNCDIFFCPLTFKGNRKQKKLKEERLGKTKILLQMPLPQRKQMSAIDLLLQCKKYKNLARLLFYDEMRTLKNLRKDKTIQNLIMQIPDCSFQIQWKSFKSFISFKSMPQDIISVYKKNNDLRIDYHIDDFSDGKKSTKHFSLLLKARTINSEFYLINHHQKKITNLFRQISPQKVKQRYQSFITNGQSQNQKIISFKSQNQNSNNMMQAAITFAYDSVTTKIPEIKNLKDYQKTLINSEMMNYQILQKSQLKSVIMENICKIQNYKQKITKSTVNVDIQWKKQHLNLSNLNIIANVLSKRSNFFKKIQKIMGIFNSQPILRQEGYHLMLPFKSKLNVDESLTIQIQIKNIVYGKIDEAVFSLQYRAKQYQYNKEEDNFELDSLRSTIFIDEAYSLNVSRFLGKSEKLIEEDDEQANKKFQQIIDRQLNNDEQDDSSDNEDRLKYMAEN